ncbi:MAG: sigma-70 family RNA polymerase sigma factor [Oligoflexia bacterium]|nr:sigma-70 family RNA polymerase sigma factor [Oligoflexia bacterium]
MATKINKRRAKNQVSIEELVVENREAAHKMAAYFLRRWAVRMDEEEVRSLADLALCEAAKRYRGPTLSKFTTYLYYYIKGELVRAIKRECQNSSLARLNDPDSSDKSAENVSVHERDELGQCSAQSPEEECEASELRGGFKRAFKTLTGLEKEIIFHVYVNEFKVASVARKLGYSRGHVSDMRRRALNKMRDLMEPFKEAA